MAMKMILEWAKAPGIVLSMETFVFIHCDLYAFMLLIQQYMFQLSTSLYYAIPTLAIWLQD